MSNLNVVRIINVLNERTFSYEKVVYDPTRKVFKIIETKVPTRKTTKKISDRKPKTQEEKVHQKISRKISKENKESSKLTA